MAMFMKIKAYFESNISNILAIFSLLISFTLLFKVVHQQYEINKYSNKYLQNLLLILRNQRLVEARLSGGFLYKSYVTIKTKSSKPQQQDLSHTENDYVVTERFNYKNHADNKIGNNKTTSKRGQQNDSEVYFSNLLSPSVYSSYIVGYNNVVKLTRSAIDRKREENDSELNSIISGILLDSLVNPSVETLHALGVLKISQDKYDEAIEVLEKASIKQPDNVYILNDLSAAYVASHEKTTKPMNLIQALSTIDKAFNLNSSLEEIRFNKALILEKLNLSPTAYDEWQEYLKLEKNSDWAKEAKEHIGRIMAPTLPELWLKEQKNLEQAIISKNIADAQEIVNKFPHFSRMYAINELIPFWAKEYFKENYSEASQALEKAEFIGEWLSHIHKDKLVIDIVITIKSTLAKGHKSQEIKKLIEAYLAYNEGEHLTENGTLDKAETLLLKAKKLFVECKNLTGEALVGIQLSRICLYRFNFNQAVEHITYCNSISEKYSYPYILGRGWLNYGRVKLKLFEPQKALLALNTAQSYFKIINDSDEALLTHISLSFVYDQIGSQDEVWKNQYEALKYVNQTIRISPIISTQNRIAIQLLSSKYLEVALYFLNESFQISLKSGIVTDIFSALFYRSQAYYKLGNKKAALSDLNIAKDYIAKTSEKSIQTRLNQLALIVESDFKLFEDPKSSIDLYSAALINKYTESEKYEVINIYLSRAKAYILTGNNEKAEADLLRSITEYENVRNSLPFEKERISFLEQVQSAYDEMITFQINQRNNEDLAFYYTEAKRSRALLDLIMSNKAIKNNNVNKSTIKFKDKPIYKKTIKPYKLTDIQSKLPKNTTIIEYSILERFLVIWVIQQNYSKMFKVPITKGFIEESTKNFCEAITKNLSKNELVSYSKPLYNNLIKPVLPSINQNHRIIIIPDKILYDLPFSAIINPLTKQYLIENFTIAISPSATIFVNCLKQDIDLTKYNKNNFLAIGNPSFSKVEFPDLKHLLYAEEEVDNILKYYPKALVLKNQNATKKVFCEIASKYNIIHFAGHAIVNSTAPLLSELIFAQDDKEKGASSSLKAYELYKLQLKQTRLVVLAACDTANGQLLQSEGVVSIARPFLANDVPIVIATLWKVDDFASKELFFVFYTEIISGKDPVAALREAQLALINNKDPMLQTAKQWAVFIPLGGVNKKEN